MSKHTHRGHCQVCGAQQAVDNETGKLAKHGYTVEHGFFEGECPGSHNLPLEHDHTMTDNIIDDLTRQADRIEQQIADGLTTIPYRYRENRFGPEKVVMVTRDTFEGVLADLGKEVRDADYQWNNGVEHREWQLQRQVTFLRDHCEFMGKLIEKRHGADLVTVERIERQSKAFADRTEAKEWLDALKAEGWTGRIVTNMYKGIGEVGRYNAQARRTV
jgi:hypothetical protein